MSAETTKMKLKNSFFELCENEPIDKITIKEIADNCGVTSQTFYNHFSDKYNLIYWAYRKRIDAIFDEFENGSITWKELLETLLRSYKKNADTVLNALNNTHGNDSYLRLSTDYMVDKLSKGIMERTGVEELDWEVDMHIRGYVAAFINIVGYWLTYRPDLPVKSMARLVNEAMPRELRDTYQQDNNHPK